MPAATSTLPRPLLAVVGFDMHEHSGYPRVGRLNCVLHLMSDEMSTPYGQVAIQDDVQIDVIIKPHLAHVTLLSLYHAGNGISDAPDVFMELRCGHRVAK